MSDYEFWHEDSDEWVTEDWKFYVRHFEEEQDNGNIEPEKRPMTCYEWWDSQPADYRQAHS